MKKITAESDLLTPSEAAAIFRVASQTVKRWDLAGMFAPGDVVRTPGGHRRYKRTAIEALLNGQGGGQS